MVTTRTNAANPCGRSRSGHRHLRGMKFAPSSQPLMNTSSRMIIFRMTMVVVLPFLSSLFFVSVDAHQRNYCRTDNLPVVVLERVHQHQNNTGTNSSESDSRGHSHSSEFVVVQRYNSSQLPEAYKEWTDAETRRRRERRKLLQVEDYTGAAMPASQGRIRGRGLLSSSSSLGDVDEDLMSGGQMAVPGLRLLHADGHHGYLNSTTEFLLENSLALNNSTDDDDESDSDDREYFLARECACFDDENYERVFCPFATDTCGQVINNHLETRPYPEIVICYTEPLQRNNSNTYKILWLLTIVVWANFMFAIVMTPKGRSCLSFIPARLPWLKDRWNPFVADYLLEYRRDQAYMMIRTHVGVLRQDLDRDFERQQRRQERQRRRAERAAQRSNRHGENSSGEPAVEIGANDVVNETDRQNRRAAAMIELVANVGGGTRRQNIGDRPTSLALQIKRYKKPTPAELPENSTNGGGENADIEDHHGDDGDDHAEDQCAICFTDFEDGDRVGSLPCDHIFHVDCLKMWLKRQNICPFCRREHVAEERFQTNDDDDGDESKSQESNDNNNDNGNDESSIAENEAPQVSFEPATVSEDVEVERNTR